MVTLLQSVVSLLLDYELEMLFKYLMINIIFVYTCGGASRLSTLQIHIPSQHTSQLRKPTSSLGLRTWSITASYTGKTKEEDRALERIYTFERLHTPLTIYVIFDCTIAFLSYMLCTFLVFIVVCNMYWRNKQNYYVHQCVVCKKKNLT